MVPGWFTVSLIYLKTSSSVLLRIQNAFGKTTQSKFNPVSISATARDAEKISSYKALTTTSNIAL